MRTSKNIKIIMFRLYNFCKRKCALKNALVYAQIYTTESVAYHSFTSRRFYIIDCVPQGSNLGPRLFVLFLNNR